MRTTVRAFLLTGFLAPLLANAQPAIQWQKCLGGVGDENAYSIQQTADGGYVVAGYTSSSNSGDVSGHHGGGLPDVWVVKLDIDGTLQWQKCLGGSARDIAYSIQQTTDAGYVVFGRTMSHNGDVSGNHGGLIVGDFWVVKLDAAGTTQWQKCLGGSEDDFGASIQQCADGGYIMTGYIYSTDGDVSGYHGGVTDAWVVKLDAAGNTLWTKCLGGSMQDSAGSIQQTADGGYIMAGRTNSNDGDLSGLQGAGALDVWIVKLDDTGTIQWQKCLGGSSTEWVGSIQQTTDGGYIVGASTNSNDGDVSGHHGNQDAWVVKLDDAGNIQWQKCLGGSGNDVATSVQQAADGGYVVAMRTNSNDGDVSGNHGSMDAWVVMLDEAGTVQWQKCLGGSGHEEAESIQQTTDGGYVVAGYTEGSNDGDVSGNHGGLDAWVVKLGPAEVGMAEEEVTRFTLAPNPTRGNVHIGFASGAKPRSVVLLDAMGRTVLVQPIANTSGTTALDLGGHENGLYFVQVRFADGSRATERVVKE